MGKGEHVQDEVEFDTTGTREAEISRTGNRELKEMLAPRMPERALDTLIQQQKLGPSHTKSAPRGSGSYSAPESNNGPWTLYLIIYPAALRSPPRTPGFSSKSAGSNKLCFEGVPTLLI